MSKQILITVSGEAGAGKSAVIGMINHVASIVGLDVQVVESRDVPDDHKQCTRKIESLKQQGLQVLTREQQKPRSTVFLSSALPPDFLPWGGVGKPPLAPFDRVVVILRSGARHERLAGQFNWEWMSSAGSDPSGDVIGYKQVAAAYSHPA